MVKEDDRVKPKIAIISPGLFSVPPVIGSSVEHDIEMVSRELRKEYQVFIYTRTCAEYPRSSVRKGVHYRRFFYRNRQYYLQQVVRDLRRERPHLIQVENRPHYISYLKKMFPQTPIILNMHSLYFATPPMIATATAQQSMQQIDALLTNSYSLQSQYERNFPFLKGKIRAVHLGIDPKPFIQAGNLNKKKLARLRSKYKLREDDQVILFVGRLKPEKGVHHLLDALPQVLKQHKQVKLLLVGGSTYGKMGATPYIRQLKKKARGYAEQVIFTRFIKPEDIPAIYSLADIVVTPSVWEEPFCRVNLEAMAARKPIVTTTSGGIPEVVRHGQHGFTLPPDRLSKQLPQVLNRLIASPELREQLGNNGFAHLSNFTWAKTAREYSRLYRQFLSS